MDMTTDFPGSNEYVMAFPTSLLHDIGYFEGLSLEYEIYLQIILKQKNYIFLQRGKAERDLNYKQLIPYVILMHDDNIFSYRRAGLISERRLKGKYSIGIGGHINLIDTVSFDMTYEEGLRREVNEEVKIDGTYKEKVVALINDDTNEVGKVHFGIIHLFSLDGEIVEPKEKFMHAPKFSTIDQLRRKINYFERWSQICISDFDRLARN